MMTTRILTTLFLFCLATSILNAQDDAKQVDIEVIRKDYYEMNSHLGEYEKVRIDNQTIAYVKGLHIYKIVIEKEGRKSIREYYFNGSKTSLYFAFLVHGSAENRYYFKDDKLIRWLDADRNYIVGTKRDGRAKGIRELAYFAFEKAEKYLLKGDPNVYLISGGKYIRLREIITEGDITELSINDGILGKDGHATADFKVDMDKLPTFYRRLLDEEFYVFDGKREGGQAKIKEFVFRVHSDITPYFNEEEANWSEQQKVKAIATKEQLSYSDLYVKLETNYLNGLYATDNASLEMYEKRNTTIPDEVKSLFEHSKEYKKIQAEYLDIKEEKWAAEWVNYHGGSGGLKYQSFSYPNKPSIHIISASAGHPCGAPIDEHYRMVLEENSGIYKQLFDGGNWPPIESVFDVDDSMELHFFFEGELVKRISKYHENGEMEVISEEIIIYSGCGC